MNKRKLSSNVRNKRAQVVEVCVCVLEIGERKERKGIDKISYEQRIKVAMEDLYSHFGI